MTDVNEGLPNPLPAIIKRKRKEREPTPEPIGEPSQNKAILNMFKRTAKMLPNASETDPLFQQRLKADLTRQRIHFDPDATLRSKDL